jgi:hypothetical protein
MKSSKAVIIRMWPVWGVGVFAQPLFAQKTSDINQIVWKLIEPNFELAEDQTWVLPAGSRPQSFQFSAVRFHLGYFELRLLSVAEIAKQIEARASRNARSLTIPSGIDLGLAVVYDANFLDQPIRAIVGAGFPASEGKPINLGLLRIDHRTLSELAPNGPSAVFCLHSPNKAYERFKYQVPVFYRLDDHWCPVNL